NGRILLRRTARRRHLADRRRDGRAAMVAAQGARRRRRRRRGLPRALGQGRALVHVPGADADVGARDRADGARALAAGRRRRAGAPDPVLRPAPAAQLVTLRETPYWWEGAPPEAETPAAPLPATADVVILGAGYTGLSAARSLARAGAAVVVL